MLDRMRQATPLEASDTPLDRLAAAAAAHEQQQALAEAKAETKRAVASQRSALAAEARNILLGIFKELARRIAAAVPNVAVRSESTSHFISVGTGTLEIDLGGKGQVFSEEAFASSGWDVICGGVIEVNQLPPPHKRAASLWYTKQANKNADYRWFEVGYEGNPLSGRGFEFEPAAVSPELADSAHSSGMGIVQASYIPVPIDDEDVDAFCQRWAHILAEACHGRLRQLPRSLPPMP